VLDPVVVALMRFVLIPARRDLHPDSAVESTRSAVHGLLSVVGGV
jgi:hypothetical protein